MKKTLVTQIVDEIATIEAGIIIMETAVNNLVQLKQQLLDSPTPDAGYTPEEIEAEIVKARKDIRGARVLQERCERRLATGDWTSPNAPEN